MDDRMKKTMNHTIKTLSHLFDISPSETINFAYKNLLFGFDKSNTI